MVLSFSLFYQLSFGQVDSISLPEVLVVAKKDSIRISSLEDLSKLSPSINLRFSGYGQPALLYVRGFNADRVKVRIEGIELNSDNFGFIDFAFLPLELFDEFELGVGTESLIKGLGGLGAVLDMNLSFLDSSMISFGVKLGSFDFKEFKSRMEIVGVKSRLSIRILSQSSENDYIYRNKYLPQSPLIRLENADFGSSSGVFMYEYRGKRVRLSFFGLNSLNARNFPSPISYLGTDRVENQQFIRNFFVSNLNYRYGLKGVSVTAAFQNEILFYNFGFEDSLIISNRSLSKKVDFVFNYYWQNLNLRVKNYWTNLSLFDNLGKRELIDKDLYHIQLDVNYVWQREKRNYKFIGSLIYRDKIRMAYGFYLRWRSLELDFGKNIRFPTLSDRFWLPGGNPNLLPEISYYCDLGYDFYFNRIDGKIKGYFNYVESWIMWKPSLYHYWVAENYGNVWAYGLELAFAREVKFLEFNFGLAYKALIDESGEPINFVPKFSGFIITKLNSFFPIEIENYFAGSHYVAYNLKTSGYWVVNVLVSKKFEISDGLSLRFEIKVNNLFSVDYEFVAGRPMPKRNFWISGVINF